MSDFTLRGRAWRVRVRHRDSGRVYVVNVHAGSRKLAARRGVMQTIRDHGSREADYTTLTVKEID